MAAGVLEGVEHEAPGQELLQDLPRLLGVPAQEPVPVREACRHLGRHRARIERIEPRDPLALGPRGLLALERVPFLLPGCDGLGRS